MACLAKFNQAKVSVGPAPSRWSASVRIADIDGLQSTGECIEPKRRDDHVDFVTCGTGFDPGRGYQLMDLVSRSTS